MPELTYKDPDTGQPSTVSFNLPGGRTKNSLTPDELEEIVQTHRHALKTAISNNRNYAPAAGKPPDFDVIGSPEQVDKAHSAQLRNASALSTFMGPAALWDGLTADQQKSAGIMAAGTLGGEALEAVPALSSAGRFMNAFKGAGKGATISDLMGRLGSALSGQPQPSITDPSQILNDTIGAGLGGVGGFFRAPQAPSKPDATKLYNNAQQEYQGWKAAKDQLTIQNSQAKTGYEKLAPVQSNVASQITTQEKLLSGAEKSAKTAAQRAFVQQQAKYNTAIAQKQAELTDLRNEVSSAQREAKAAGNIASTEGKMQTGQSLANLDDQILAEQEKLAKMKGQEFEADPETVAELKKVIKKNDADVTSLKGGAKMGAKRRLDEAKAKLDEVRGGPASDEEANSNAILESQRKLRELQASKSQISRTGISSIDEGMLKTYGNKTKDSALEAFQKKQQELNALKVGQKQHAEQSIGSDPKFAADTQKLNELRDAQAEIKAKRHDLFNEWKDTEHQLKVHGTKDPGVPKAPSDKDKALDILKSLGMKVPNGSIPGALAGFALHHAGVSGPASTAVGAGITGLTAALTQTPQGQALMRQAPNAIPAVTSAAIPLEQKIKEMLGGK